MTPFKNFFQKVVPASLVGPVMSDQDRDIIVRFARGETDLRGQATDIFHRSLRQGIGPRSTPEMRFMAEVDHVAPDLGLRATYRSELLMAAASKQAKPVMAMR
jgi:hypothetical protein